MFWESILFDQRTNLLLSDQHQYPDNQVGSPVTGPIEQAQIDVKFWLRADHRSLISIILVPLLSPHMVI